MKTPTTTDASTTTSSRFPVFIILILVCLTAAAVTGVDTPQPPRYSLLQVKGSIRTDLVVIDRVQICGCWQGPNGQAQKKVKFRIKNNSGQTLNIRGGKDSSLFLVVDFPLHHQPQMEIPASSGWSSSSFTSGPDTVPSGQQLFSVEDVESVKATAISAELNADLGVPAGRKAYAIPANPNRAVEVLGSGSITFPTFVSQESLVSGAEYYDPAKGVGDWVFYVPYGAEGAHHASGFQIVGDDESETDMYEEYFRVLGIMAVGRDEQILGFSPVPPETAYSHANQF